MATTAPAMLGWMNSLADLTRMRLLLLLERHELTVAELCAVLQIPQSTVSRHLKVLADDNWVVYRPEGTSRLYRMHLNQLDPAARRLWALFREQSAQTSSAEDDDKRLASVLAERQTRSQSFFSTTAGQWDKLRDESYGTSFATHALTALLPDDWVVADLGCGTGQLTAQLAAYVKQVVGVDQSSAMLKAATMRTKSMPNVELRRGDLSALPIDDASCNAAVLLLALSYLAEPPTALEEAARILKPGGTLVLVDLVHHDRDDFRQRMGQQWMGFEPQQMKDLLTEASLINPFVTPLPHEREAKGPALLLARAHKPA